MKSEFENSIKRSSSYEKLVYQHGERLFIFDDGKYKIAAVQLAWEIFKEKQTEVDELQKENSALVHVVKSRDIQLENEKHEYDELMNKLVDSRMKKADLQKQVDAVKGLAQTLWEKSEEKHQQGKVWESKTLGECADEILDVLEQALKCGGE